MVSIRSLFKAENPAFDTVPAHNSMSQVLCRKFHNFNLEETKGLDLTTLLVCSFKEAVPVGPAIYVLSIPKREKSKMLEQAVLTRFGVFPVVKKPFIYRLHEIAVALFPFDQTMRKRGFEIKDVFASGEFHHHREEFFVFFIVELDVIHHSS